MVWFQPYVNIHEQIKMEHDCVDALLTLLKLINNFIERCESLRMNESSEKLDNTTVLLSSQHEDIMNNAVFVFKLP